VFEANEMADEIPPLTISVEPREGLTLDGDVFRIDRGRVAPKKREENEPRKPAVDHIPWSYGSDNITAMVVDPNRLFLYWELTEAAITQARSKLGSGALDAWVNLRIYDITGRIFDGTNAHGYFDIKVERSDRQWFVHIGKPASTHCVEIGLKSFEGYFVKVARSGRADFPRFEPSPDGSVAWLTVQTAVGPVGPPKGGPLGGDGSGKADGAGVTSARSNGLGGGDGHAGFAPLAVTQLEVRTMTTHASTHRWEEVVGGPIHLAHVSWAQLREVFHHQMLDGRRMLEWVTPLLVRGSWEGGPYETMQVELPTTEIEHSEGPVTVYALEGGRTRVVYGPWQVVVKGIDGRAESRILSRWALETSWIVDAGYARVVREFAPLDGAVLPEDHALAPTMAGSSAALGGSERMWLSASELRLAGGSEAYRLGASELLRRGASELLIAAASEVRLGGASDLRWGFASEERLGGSSEMSTDGDSGLGSDSRLGASESWGGRSSSFALQLPDFPLGGER
jgi:hypothetical protein